MRRILFFVAVLAFCSCGKKSAESNRLVLVNFADPKTFNPITAAETSSRDIIYMLFSGLTTKDQVTQEVKPALAESWSVEGDQKTWTFKLRKNLQWSDGKPLTADDVIFTFNDVVYNPAIPNTTVDTVRVDKKNFEVSKVDDLTIKVVTPDIYAPFLEYFGDVHILPKHILEKTIANKSFESAYGVNTPPAELIGAGPFKLKQYKPGQFTLVERNPYYWQVDAKGKRLPYFDAVVMSIVPDQNAMSLRFMKGEADLIEFVRPEEADAFKQAGDRGQFRFMDLGFASQIDLIIFNQNTNKNPTTGKPYVNPAKVTWFRNTKFRQAISYAIDRPSIVRSTINGHGQPQYGFITPSNQKWINTNVAQYPYNPEKARQLLAEIGIKDRNNDGVLEDAEGNTIEFEMNTNSGNSRREKGSVIVQEDLKRLGIKVNFRPQDFNTIAHRLDTDFDFECIYLGLASESVDPAESLNVLRSEGFLHQWFPRQKSASTEWEARMDAAMNGQLKTLNFAERKKYFDEVQAIFAEQQPMMPTVTMKAYAAARNDLANLRPTAYHHNRLIWNLPELYFKK
ncbi:MAG TPA: ABC transporter substrate-binding protein [Verrucomicrobiae bacterium]|nr:ABC transporter substrate-binding protein [Verrucomicrobiae bacterium]